MRDGMCWLPAMVIATVGCVPAGTPERVGTAVTPPTVLRGAAAVAANMEVSTPPECSVTVGTVLTGRVIDGSTGRPLADVGVSALPGCVVRTDAEGEYRLGPLGEGHFQLMVESGAYYDEGYMWVRTGDVSGASGREIPVRDIRARPTRCTDSGAVAHVRGVVVDDSTGDPVMGAQTGLVSTFCGAMTRADGRFAITAPVGKYTLTVRRIGYSVVEAEIALGAGDTTELHVRMRPARGFLRAPTSADSARSP